MKLLLGMILWALLDQGTKYLAKIYLAEHPLVIWPQMVQLTLTYNTGGAFSIGQQMPQGLAAVSILVFSSVLLYGLLKQRFTAAEFWGFSLLLGGALGNVIDRLRWGRVTDFIDIVAIRYPVFNLADSCIVCGVLLLLWHCMIGSRRPSSSSFTNSMPEA